MKNGIFFKVNYLIASLIGYYLFKNNKHNYKQTNIQIRKKMN